jgi:hypothetical protein
MAGITFSEQEVKKLILALAGSKAMPDEPQESEDSEKDEPEEKPEQKSEGEPFDTKAMLEKKLKER